MRVWCGAGPSNRERDARGRGWARAGGWAEGSKGGKGRRGIMDGGTHSVTQLPKSATTNCGGHCGGHSQLKAMRILVFAEAKKRVPGKQTTRSSKLQ